MAIEKRSKRDRRGLRKKENKHKTEDNTEKFKPCGSLASKQQEILVRGGRRKKKEPLLGLCPVRNVFVSVATSVMS